MMASANAMPSSGKSGGTLTSINQPAKIKDPKNAKAVRIRPDGTVINPNPDVAYPGDGRPVSSVDPNPSNPNNPGSNPKPTTPPKGQTGKTRGRGKQARYQGARVSRANPRAAGSYTADRLQRAARKSLGYD